MKHIEALYTCSYSGCNKHTTDLYSLDWIHFHGNVIIGMGVWTLTEFLFSEDLHHFCSTNCLLSYVKEKIEELNNGVSDRKKKL